MVIALLVSGCRKESAGGLAPVREISSKDAHVVAAEDAHQVVDGAADEGPLREAWRQCKSDNECVAIVSPCGTAFVNTSAKQDAQAAWTAACTDPPASRELSKRPSPACRNSHCVDSADLGTQLGP